MSATGGKNATGISSDQLHEGILAAMDSDLVMHSDNLHEYFPNNHGANHTIYVNDTRVFIDMSQVEKKLDKRQFGKSVTILRNYSAYLYEDNETKIFP